MKKIFFLLIFFLYSSSAEIIEVKKTNHSSSQSYRDDSLMIVVDNKTKLMWQDDIAAKETVKDWYGAKDYCKTLRLGKFSDWRLPTRMELFSITDDKKSFPAIKDNFKNYQSGTYAAYTS